MGLGMSRRSGQPSETCTGRDIENVNVAFAWINYIVCLVMGSVKWFVL
jgi:hypothetical protein